MAGLVVLALALAWTAAALAAGHGEPGPVYPVEILVGDREADLRLLTRLGIDVDAVFGDRVRAYVVEEEEEKLALLGFDLARIPDDALLAPEAAGYHTYATLTTDLQKIAQDHPDIARLASAGQSVAGRELWIMKITKNPDVEEDEPEFRYIAAIHGDEVVGKENCFDLIELLTDGYGTDPRITALVDSMEIWIMPSMNPDGTAAQRRYNNNGYDLNRNFPDRIQDPVDSTVGRQPETAAVMNWGYAHSPVLSANFHAGTVVANYPWDGNAEYSSVYTPTDDDALFVSLARTYADANPAMRVSNSDPSYNNGICNGADWYVIYGGLQDWNYVWHGDNEVTFEITAVKWPSATLLPGYWDENRESMLAYLERVHEGIRGVVTDSGTGAPLAATVRVVGIDHSVFTDPDRGDYHRMLLGGRYDVEVSAPGYNTALIEGVEVVQGGPAVRHDVALDPLATELQPVGSRVLDGPGGNGALDPGEESDLAVTLRDLGLGATGVSATLIPTGWYGAVVRAEAGYPDLPTGGSAESLAPHFRVSLASGAPPGYRAGYAIGWNTGEGSGTTEPFYLAAGAPSCSTFASTDVPKSISDRATASSTIPVAADGEIAEVNVYVDIRHTYVGDLQVTLVSPAGTPVLLHDRSGGSADDIVGWYDTARAPVEPLSRMSGEHGAGTWTLRVNDGVPSNTGTIAGWSLELCTRPFESSTPEIRFRDLAREGDGVALTWWPYPAATSYRVYRATAPGPRSGFTDVTAEDAGPSDTRFEDATQAPLVLWLVTGVGPGGEGPR